MKLATSHFAALAVAFTLLASSAALAQREVPAENRENVQLAGTLKQIGPGVLQLATESGDQWVVRLEGRPQELKLVYGGKADPNFLRSGMLVQFAGTVNKRGQVQEELSSLIVTSLREGVEIGVYPEVGGGQTGGLFTDEKPDAKPKKQPKVDAVPCRIAGYVTKISRTGELTVNCRNAVVTAKLAEKAQIAVDLNNLSLALPGDKVELRGWHVKNQKGQAWTRDVSVTAVNVLGEAKKKPRGTDKADPKDADQDDKPQDAPDKSEKADKK